MRKEITALLKEANKLLPSLSEEDQALIKKTKEEREGNIGLERLQEIKKQLETMKEKYKLVQTETMKPADDADKADKKGKSKIRGKIAKLIQDFTSKYEKLANEENSLSEDQKKSLEDMKKRMNEIDEERRKDGISVEELGTLQAKADPIMKYIQSLEDTENAKKEIEKLKNDILKACNSLKATYTTYIEKRKYPSEVLNFLDGTRSKLSEIEKNATLSTDKAKLEELKAEIPEIMRTVSKEMTEVRNNPEIKKIKEDISKSVKACGEELKKIYEKNIFKYFVTFPVVKVTVIHF